MSHNQNEKYVQFPIRLQRPLAEALDAVSSQTRIPKTTISRLALERFLVQMDAHGMLESIDRVMTS